MNILVPDSWLRDFLKTKATPKQIQEYLSLSGPSVERINVIGKETVYDIEITSNRPDSMSVVGVAREAAAILPRAGIPAELVGDPYKGSTLSASRQLKQKGSRVAPLTRKRLIVSTDPVLNPRFTAIIIEDVKIAPSPQWLTNPMELTGTRAINNVVDVTNYIMKLYGQPAHAFDFDKIAASKTSATMKLRASKRGEKLTTLDGKTHTLPGNDIVIEDYKGALIDLCGIMGGANSHIWDKTKTIILFMQTYNPMNIRQTSMALAHRTEAAALFEKSLDPELVLPSMMRGIELMVTLTGGKVASRLYDIYPKPYKPSTVSCSTKKIDSYVGKQLTSKEIKQMLTPLGFTTIVNKKEVIVSVPSFRRDVTIDVDVIEETARIYGYHHIATKLPDREPPVVSPQKALTWEEEVKIRLRDWGYTETYTYSMISEEQMTEFKLSPSHAYKIANPLSGDWVYLRPSLLPSMLSAISQNLHIRDDFSLFELSMVYRYRVSDLPIEIPTLIVATLGHRFFEAKGVAQAIFSLFGIPFPTGIEPAKSPHYDPTYSLQLEDYGFVGEINTELLTKQKINIPVTVLELDFAKLVSNAMPGRTYTPIPRYPPVVEDLAFIVPPGSHVGPMIAAFQKAHPLISDVSLLDAHEQTRTFHVSYLDTKKNLLSEDVRPIREKLITLAQSQFGATLKEH